MSVKNLIRENILTLEPYRCARDEFEGDADIYLDANENYRTFLQRVGINRYPDPHSARVVEAVHEVFGFPKEKVIIGNGSDEIIDLLIRIFCNPGRDSILIFPPTYGAYKVFASINDVEVHTAELAENFELDEKKAVEAIDAYKPKIVFICSPNNPTGNSFDLEVIRRIAEHNPGITVVDEAYHDFSEKPSAYTLMDENERIVVMRTLSKAWGLAGARIGICVSSEEIHDILYNVKYPYNVPLPSQQAAVSALEKGHLVKKCIEEVLLSREILEERLARFKGVHVFPSDANFLLVRVPDAESIYRRLIKKGIIVRLRSSEPGCRDCLRITIGSHDENVELYNALKELLNE